MNPQECLSNLTSSLGKLPGVGRRSAERMAMRLVRERDGLLPSLLNALQSVRDSLCCCEQCGSVTAVDRNPCRLCTDETRDATVLCVVENPDDVAVIERSGAFRGRYHALMGRISPMRGEGPEDIRLRLLMERVGREGFREVILALSTDVEGDATASYVAHLLKAHPVKVTRLAFGLPAGSGVVYSDPVTLARAIEGKTEVKC